MSLDWGTVGSFGTKITTSIGTLGAAGTGAYTIVALLQPTATRGAALGMKVSSSYDRQIIIDTSKYFGGADFSAGFGTATLNNWQIIGQSKASGTNVYRWHFWNYTLGGAKTHANGTGTHGDPGTITTVEIGQADSEGRGMVAVVAVWKRVLSDAEFDSLCTTNLTDWAALTPDALWPLNVAPASVVDVTGNGANASSVSGTITSGAADPPSFNYTLSSGFTINANGITSAAQPGAQSVSLSPTPGGIASSEQLGSPVVSLSPAPSGIVSSERLGSPTVTASNTINANGITSTERVGSQTVTRGSVSVSPSGIISTERLGTPTISLLTQINASGIVSTERVGAVTATPGSVTLNANGIVSNEAVGQLSTSQLTQILPNGITSNVAVGNSTISATYTINANGITTSEATGSPAVGLLVTPAAIPSGERLGQPSFTLNASASGIDSNERLGSPTVTPSAVTINANGIVTGEAVGSTLIILAQSITAAGIATLQALGTPTISVGSVTINPGSIVSGEQIGNAALNVSITASGVPSNEILGSPTITVTAAGISAGNIVSSEQFGSPSISSTITVTVNGIRSEERFGAATLYRVVQPGGVTSNEKVGSPNITVGVATINAKGIVSQEAFGIPLINALPLIPPTPNTLIRFRVGQTNIAMDAGLTRVRVGDAETLLSL